ncbi:hypothetical protein IAQ61_009308 [Plenodomus lingam]|nr:hypothetical protein IAQ61_009308 [Plenodomus lingam]
MAVLYLAKARSGIQTSRYYKIGLPFLPSHYSQLGFIELTYTRKGARRPTLKSHRAGPIQARQREANAPFSYRQWDESERLPG